MSAFAVQVRSIRVSPHPNADKLEIGQVDGYQFVVAKGDFKDGDLGVYIPEQALVPAPLIIEMGLEGRLSGTDKNRVKAIQLRGVLSQGLFYQPKAGLPAHWAEGLDVGQELGIIKWEPTIPKELRGEIMILPKAWRIPSGESAPVSTIFRSYDVENIKHYPDVLAGDEEVAMTEKVHGTCVIVGILDGCRVVSSKGVAAKGFVLKESEINTYWRIAREFQLFEKLEMWMAEVGLVEAILFGEGLGVQDLMYGLERGQLAYRAFDLLIGGGYLPHHQFRLFCEAFEIPAVPVVYRGPFSKEALENATNGASTLPGAAHIREGVVVRPVIERTDRKLGRVILKSVSPAYLTRKGEQTEFN